VHWVHSVHWVPWVLVHWVPWVLVPLGAECAVAAVERGFSLVSDCLSRFCSVRL
jgi:hypothetical protein